MDATPSPDTPAVAPTPPPAVPAEVLEQVAVSGDLSGLTAAQRLAYYRAVCQSLGLNPLTKPFEYLTLNGKLRLYALRDCADQLRRLHGLSITITGRERLGDLYLVTARATDRHGRTDESLGAVAVGALKGDALANALMKCETKAKRRVTMSLAGLGWLDETELETIPAVRTGEPEAPQAPSPPAGVPDTQGSTGRLPPAERLSYDEARELKKAAQTAFGYREGERRLRADWPSTSASSGTRRCGPPTRPRCARGSRAMWPRGGAAMASRPTTASIWVCEGCQTGVYAADGPTRLRCRGCGRWMTRVVPRSPLTRRGAEGLPAPRNLRAYDQ
jgi:hypothetical protein